MRARVKSVAACRRVSLSNHRVSVGTRISRMTLTGGGLKVASNVLHRVIFKHLFFVL